MLTSFWAGLGNNLAERWAAVILTPAFVFWLGGLAAWAWGHGGGSEGWEEAGTWITDRSSVVQVALAVGALLVVAASGVVVQRLTLPAIRLLEGYWPRWLEPLRRRLIDRQSRRVVDDDKRFGELERKIQEGSASAGERHEHATLDRRLRRIPTEGREGEVMRRMPTRLGNTLRAAETWPNDKYGLDAVKCWPRLWLVLPEGVKKELSDARAGLDAAAGLWIWGVLFLVWTVWAWWALPVGVGVSLAAYVGMVNSATAYGDLVESAFDIYRPSLYAALRWPMPSSPAEEQQCGEAVTRYLWRGYSETNVRFTPLEVLSTLKSGPSDG